METPLTRVLLYEIKIIIKKENHVSLEMFVITLIIVVFAVLYFFNDIY